ncbi:retrovirus-related Pol polyprotein from type-2 retrotransposable element R2DM, partial [Nephila pilipes]
MEIHLNSHPPSKKRSKARAAFRKIKSELTPPIVHRSAVRSDLEKTFREKFPDLPVFNHTSSSSADSSPDYDFLANLLQAPTTGPPTITSFPKRDYSLIVKKGLFRCEFCEKGFVTKIGIDSHYDKIHNIKPQRIIPKLFPGGRTDICHFCCHSPKGDQSLADHYRNAHNLEVHSDRPYATSTTIDVSPNNFTSALPKQRDLASNSHSIIVTPSPKPDIKSDPITINADIHSPPSSRPEDISFRTCSECGFIAQKTSGLKLHYFKTHKIRKIPKKITIPAAIEVIETLPECPSIPKKQEKTTENVLVQQFQTKKEEKIVKPTNESREFYNSTFNNDKSPDLPIESQYDSTEIQVPSTFIDRHNHPQYPYVSLHNNVLKYCFPVPLKINCPYPNCSSSFGTKAWYLTNSSIKKHLNIFHRTPPNSVEFHCFYCKKKISKNPSKHICLKGNLVIPNSMFLDDSEWTCSTCNDFSTNSQLAKRNHLASHKREKIRNQSTPLIIPESSSQSKRRKRSKVAPLSEGAPGDMRIAPPIMSINQDTLGNCEKDSNALPSDDEDENISPKIDLPVPSVLNSFLDPLDALIEVDDVSNGLETFENLMSGITTAVQDFFHLPPKRSSGNKNITNRKAFDPMNAQEVQKLYKWNRRRCVRQIALPVSNRCPISKTSLHDHFLKTWGAPNQDYILQPGKNNERPPILDSLDPEFVLSCLQTCENSAPGSDQISYRQWREVDPRCLALSRIFNICLKFKDIPRAWKISNCVLIHKKDDLDLIDNWRPIALSNTIYKLFMKCLTRKLQDWCEFNQVLSSAQKGFTPHDGVIEHNFLLAQSLELAKRNKTDIFLAFLDISNAFGSIPHEVIFKVMEREGVDAEFSTMIENIYLGSSTCVLSEEGPTEPIPILRGVKQGCPLSGILFNLAINHVLVDVQGEQEGHKILAFADDL